MRRHIAAYRLILGLYPAKFRRAYGDEMTLLFADLLADQRQSGKPLGTLRLWVHAVTDAISTAPRERMEESMNNSVALTRILLIALPIAAFGALGIGLGAYAGLAVLVVGIILLVARRRSLPKALVGSGRGRWWIWTLAGLAMVGTSIGLATLGGDENLPGDENGELSWLLWALLFFSGALIVAASVVRGLALLMARRSTSTD